MIQKSYGTCGGFQSDLRSAYGCFSVQPMLEREGSRVAAAGDGSAQPRALCGGWAHVASHGPFRAVDVACSWVSCRRAAVPAAPWKDTVGIMIGLEGRLEIEHYGRRQCLERRDILVIDTREDGIFETWEGSRSSVLHMPRSELVGARLGGDVFGRVISGRDYTGRLLGALLLALAECEESIEAGDRDVTTEVVVSLVSQALEGGAPEAGRCNDIASRLRSMSAWLMGHIGESDLSLDRLAAEFALSRRSLFRLFARAGYTPQSWIRDQRLDYAHRRLLGASVSEPGAISRICYESGFNDLSTFCRSFRRRFGVPPSALCGASRVKAGD
jgi:AraC-like DNA-binding protein